MARNWSRFAGIILAFALAFAAQSLFTGQPFPMLAPASWTADLRFDVGAGLLLAAMAVFAWAMSGAKPDDGSHTKMIVPGEDAEPERGFRAIGLYLAVGCYLLSLLLYFTTGESALVRVLWVMGVALLIVSRIPRRKTGPLDPERDRMTRWEWALLVVITMVAFGLRYWRLTQIPSNLDGDIASVGLQTWEVAEPSQPQWIGVGWSDYPLFFFNVLAWIMRLFGQNLYGLMIGSVILGTLTIPAVYWMGREMFGRRVGLIAAALLAVSYTHIQYSRVVVVEPAPLVVTLLVFLLFRGLRTQQKLWFALAGAMLGVGLLIYFPARIGLALVGLLFIWLLIWRRPAVSTHLGNWVILGLGALLAFGPMLGFAAHDFRAFFGRANDVTLASADVRAHLMDKYHVETLGGLLAEQFKRSFLVFHAYGDDSSLFAFPGPMVDALTAALLVLGMGYCLAKLKSLRRFILAAWVVSVLVLGGVMTNDPPFWPHLIVVLPAVAVIAAIAAEQVWEGLAQPLNRTGPWIVGALMAAALLYTGVHNWQVYYQFVRDNADQRIRIIRYVTSLPAGYRVELSSDLIGWQDREFQFLARDVTGEDITAEQLRTDPQLCLTAPVVFILTPDHFDLLPDLQSRCPGGQVKLHAGPSGWLAFKSFTVAPDDYVRQALPPSQIRAEPVIWWMAGGWALILALATGLYYFFVVRRIAARRMVERGAGPAAAMAQPGRLLPPSWQVALNRLEGWWRQLDEWKPPSLRTSRVGETIMMWTSLLAALGLAYLAQIVLDAQTENELRLFWLTGWSESLRLWLGVCIYLAAMLAWMFVAPDIRSGPQNSRSSDPPALSRSPWRARARLIVLGAGLSCYALAMLIFGSLGESRLVQGLWAGGIILFVASFLPGAQASPRFRWGNVVVLAAILAAAFVLRFYRLETIPSDFHGDMASHGLIARDIMLGVEQHLFHDTWANLPLMTFLPAAFSLKLFGNDLFGLQMTSVIGGMLSLLGFYLLVWRLFGRHRLAALATALVAINTVHIHFSRIAEYMDPWPLAIFALFLLIDGLKANRRLSLALAGVLMGLSVQMYYSGRVVVLIAAAFLLYALLFQRQWVAQNWRGLGWMAVGSLIAFGPDLIFFARNWDAFIERSREVWLFEPNVMTHLQDKYAVHSVIGVVLEQAKRSILMFHHSIDSSTQFGYPHPMFSSLVSPLIVLGLGYSLRRWRRPGMILALAWLLLMIVVGSTLTVDAPFWPRLVGVVPPAALLAALALDQLVELADKLSSRNVTPILMTIIALFLVFVGWQNWDRYYRMVQDNARPQARIGRYLYNLPPQVTACNFVDPYELQVRETLFLAWPRQVVDLPSDASDADLDACPGPPLVWILSPNHLDRLDALRIRWPGGIIQGHFEPDHTHVFASYLVWGDSQ